jgi:hypothetical protein
MSRGSQLAEKRAVLDGSKWHKKKQAAVPTMMYSGDKQRGFLTPRYRRVASLDDDCSNAESVVLVVSVCPTR